jgi:hypothetical protein
MTQIPLTWREWWAGVARGAGHAMADLVLGKCQACRDLEVEQSCRDIELRHGR